MSFHISNLIYLQTEIPSIRTDLENALLETKNDDEYIPDVNKNDSKLIKQLKLRFMKQCIYQFETLKRDGIMFLEPKKHFPISTYLLCYKDALHEYIKKLNELEENYKRHETVDSMLNRAKNKYSNIINNDSFATVSS